MCTPLKDSFVSTRVAAFDAVLMLNSRGGEGGAGVVVDV